MIMKLTDLRLPNYFSSHYNKFPNLTPIQKKAVNSRLLQNKSLLICAPTASGKTLIATMAIVNKLNIEGKKDTELKQDNKLEKGKAIYLVPLKALANEKYKEYLKLFENTEHKVIMSTGDIDSESSHLANYDLLILTTEKLDSLLRHRVGWLSEVKTVIVDEIHLLNDTNRGPTLEVILTLLKGIIKPQIIGLSATIGNPKELATWLNAKLVMDDWRPVELKKGIRVEGKTEFYS